MFKATKVTIGSIRIESVISCYKKSLIGFIVSS
jgi:hypothetical protein